jgi:hypothetical protein
MTIVDAKIGFTIQCIPRAKVFDQLILTDDQTKEETVFEYADLTVLDFVNYISIKETLHLIEENHTYNFVLLVGVDEVLFRGTFKALSNSNYSNYIDNKETSYSVGKITSNSTENKYKIYE